MQVEFTPNLNVVHAVEDSSACPTMRVVMKRIVFVACTLLVTATAYAAPREIRHDRRELRRDHVDIRADRRELRQDLRQHDRDDVRQDRRELKQDHREVRQDRRELRHDRR